MSRGRQEGSICNQQNIDYTYFYALDLKNLQNKKVFILKNIVVNVCIYAG